MSTAAAIYCRVSTKEQKEGGYSLSNQQKQARQYAAGIGLQVVTVLMDDISGVTRLEDREGGKQLLEMAHMGQIQHLIVWRLDRLSRPPEDELSRLLTMIEQLARCGVTVHDCRSGAVQNDMFTILRVFFESLAASKERKDIGERSKVTRMEKARQGKYVGTGRAPYGYRKTGTRRSVQLAIDPEQAAVIRRAFDMYLGRNGHKRHALNAIADRLTAEGVPTPYGKVNWWPANVRDRIIRARTVLGEFEYGGIVIRKPELAIIDEDTWNAAQDRIAKNKQRSTRHQKAPYLLSGHLLCSCGATMHGIRYRKSARQFRYYRCSKRTHRAKYADCDQPGLTGEIVEVAVWQQLVDFLSDDDKLNEGLDYMAQKAAQHLEPAIRKIAAIDDLLRKTVEKKRRLLTAFGDVEDGDIQDTIRRCVELERSLTRERAGWQAKVEQGHLTPAMREQIKVMAMVARRRLQQGGTFENKRELLDALNIVIRVQREGERTLLAIDCDLGTLGAIEYDSTITASATIARRCTRCSTR